MISLEKVGEFDETLLYWFDTLYLYVWDPEQRYELEIESYLDIFKSFIVLCNFFVYWQMPEVFIALMAA